MSKIENGMDQIPKKTKMYQKIRKQYRIFPCYVTKATINTNINTAALFLFNKLIEIPCNKLITHWIIYQATCVLCKMCSSLD